MAQALKERGQKKGNAGKILQRKKEIEKRVGSTGKRRGPGHDAA
jgi:hypothetical protein